MKISPRHLPGKREKLENHIRSQTPLKTLKTDCSTALQAIIMRLVNEKILFIQGNKVIYSQE
ncbi:hypothetical protein CBG46_04925 [Actinobacillus succinogenes]|nr:hypothetical protein CBG46_04925 [Actinobacillus succinogenes]